MATAFTDILAMDEVDQFFTPVSGKFALGQSIARELMTPVGQHPSDPDYGLDLRNWIGMSADTHSVFTLKAMTKAVCMRDPRVLDASVQVFAPLAGVNGDWRIWITVLTEEGASNFSLTISTQDEEGQDVATIVNRTVPTVCEVTDTSTLFIAKNVNRKGLYVMNTSPNVPVYYSFGSAVDLSVNLYWPASFERRIEPVNTQALHLRCPPGLTAKVLIEESY